MIFSANHLAGILRTTSSRLRMASKYLCELDGQIGDGDHGTTMVLGFEVVTQRLIDQDLSRATPGDIFALNAEDFLNAVGATVGPLYASAFQEAATFAKGHPDLDIADTPLILVAMADGIGARGKAKPGDKTMMDVWYPVAQHIRAARLDGTTLSQIARDLRVICTDSVAATKAMVASKGRAARLGERSLGHADPGASSAAIIIGSFCDFFEEHAP
tara:strand:+ start:6880 stop:7527 length:648 start_codon:yes stop_codon:yes gene_type:complete